MTDATKMNNEELADFVYRKAYQDHILIEAARRVRLLDEFVCELKYAVTIQKGIDNDTTVALLNKIDELAKPLPKVQE